MSILPSSIAYFWFKLSRNSLNDIRFVMWWSLLLKWIVRIDLCSRFFHSIYLHWEMRGVKFKQIEKIQLYGIDGNLVCLMSTFAVENIIKYESIWYKCNITADFVVIMRSLVKKRNILIQPAALSCVSQINSCRKYRLRAMIKGIFVHLRSWVSGPQHVAQWKCHEVL